MMSSSLFGGNLAMPVHNAEIAEIFNEYADLLELMRFGVYQARRGWLEAENVLSTRSSEELKRLLRKK